MAVTDTQSIFYQDVMELPLLANASNIHVGDMVILVQRDITRRLTISTLMKKIIEVIDVKDGKSAYEIACDHGFEGTEEEWLETIGASEDLRAILGPYHIIDASISGSGVNATLLPNDPETVINNDEFNVYRVKDENDSYTYYTKDVSTGEFTSYEGMIKMTELMHTVIGNVSPEDVYVGVLNGHTVAGDISASRIYTKINNTWTTKSLSNLDNGEIINVKTSESENEKGKWYYVLKTSVNNSGSIKPYSTITEYIQDLVSNSQVGTAAYSDTTGGLKTPVDVKLIHSSIYSEANNKVIAQTSTDGSSDVVLEVNDNVIHPATLMRSNYISYTTSAFTARRNATLSSSQAPVNINITGVAQAIKDPINITLTGDVTGSGTGYINGSDNTITVSTNASIAGSVDIAKALTGTSVTTGTKTRSARKIQVVGAAKGAASTSYNSSTLYWYNSDRSYTYTESISNLSAYLYDAYGSSDNIPTRIVITEIDGSAIRATSPVPISITGSAQTANSVSLSARSSNLSYLVGVASTNESSNRYMLYDTSIYAYSKYISGVGTQPVVKSPYFEGNLIGNADTATKATNDSYGNNIYNTYARKTDTIANITSYEQRYDYEKSIRNNIGTFSSSIPKRTQILNMQTASGLSYPIYANDPSSSIVPIVTSSSLLKPSGNQLYVLIGVIPLRNCSRALDLAHKKYGSQVLYTNASYKTDSTKYEYWVDKVVTEDSVLHGYMWKSEQSKTSNEGTALFVDNVELDCDVIYLSGSMFGDSISTTDGRVKMQQRGSADRLTINTAISTELVVKKSSSGYTTTWQIGTGGTGRSQITTSPTYGMSVKLPTASESRIGNALRYFSNESGSKSISYLSTISLISDVNTSYTYKNFFTSAEPVWALCIYAHVEVPGYAASMRKYFTNPNTAIQYYSKSYDVTTMESFDTSDAVLDGFPYIETETKIGAGSTPYAREWYGGTLTLIQWSGSPGSRVVSVDDGKSTLAAY